MTLSRRSLLVALSATGATTATETNDSTDPTDYGSVTDEHATPSHCTGTPQSSSRYGDCYGTAAYGDPS